MIVIAILLSVLTTLSDGMFHTSYETATSASITHCNATIDSLISCLQTNPEMLSQKFYGGLGKQQDANKNAFYLIWKESEYDPTQQYSKLVLDVLVDQRPFLRNVVIESQVTDSLHDNRRDIRVDIDYAGTLLKQAYGTFHVQPIDVDSVKIAMDVHVKFGWFFRIFISRKVYSETVDWRLERFVENLRLLAEGEEPTDEYWEKIDQQ